jgi:hypothetical protein
VPTALQGLSSRHRKMEIPIHWPQKCCGRSGGLVVSGHRLSMLKKPQEENCE